MLNFFTVICATVGFNINLQICSFVNVKKNLICKIEEDSVYRGDRDLSGIGILTLKVQANVQATVFVKEVYFSDVKAIRITGNCPGVKVVSKVVAKCMKVCIIVSLAPPPLPPHQPPFPPLPPPQVDFVLLVG